ncbi:MAG: LysR family transcriptional regulator [Actinomycetota bacterium]|nr:LysR family transcriptional regulator [Actinomycetota bacterium]
MSFDEVEFRHLRALRAVAEEGSFVGAADVLGFSQAAISQQIAGLEKAVGTSLFDRPGGPKPVTLTPAGRLFLRHADAVIERLGTAERELADLASGTAGRLVIGTYQSVSVQLLPDLVREMRATAPDIHIHLVERDDNETLISDLLAGELDVTFLTGPYEDSRLDIIDLGIDPFVVLLDKDGDLARAYKGRSFPTKELNGIPMVGQHQCDCQTAIDDGLRSSGVRPRYVFRSNDNGAMQGMVRAGMGPAVMPLLAVDTADPGIVVKQLDPPLDPRTIMIGLRHATTPLPAAGKFVRIAKSECRKRLARAAR